MPYKVGSLEIPAKVIAEGRWTPGKINTPWYPSGHYQLPEDLAFAKDQIVEHLVQQGKRVGDGQGVGMMRCVRHAGILNLSFRPASYFTNLASHELPQYLGDPVLADLVRPLVEKYKPLAQLPFDRSPLSNRPQLACSVLTSDLKLLVVQRSKATAVASGSYHASVVGGVRPERGDCDSSYSIPVAAMIRQAKEELGLELNLWRGDRIVFRFLALDEQRLYQPMLAGVIRTKLTADQVLERYRNHAPDKWEAQRWLKLDAQPSDVHELLTRVEKMPAVGQLALLAGLLERHQMSNVVSAFSPERQFIVDLAFDPTEGLTNDSWTEMRYEVTAKDEKEAIHRLGFLLGVFYDDIERHPMIPRDKLPKYVTKVTEVT